MGFSILSVSGSSSYILSSLILSCVASPVTSDSAGSVLELLKVISVPWSSSNLCSKHTTSRVVWMVPDPSSYT